MLRVLLAKDLRRARRNPLPWLINLALPLCITALIGLVFGGKSDSGALGRIRFAVVDEDKTVLSDFLRGSANQREGGKYLEPVFLGREEAMRQILDDKLSAAVIIPTNFMRNYLTGRAPVSLELVKNPAESIHPAVLEELLGAVVTAMNAVARNFQSEFPDWQAVFEGKGDYRDVSRLIDRAGDKLKTAKKYVDPPLIMYDKEMNSDNATGNRSGTGGAMKTSASGKGPAFNIFGYLLVGMAAMFLLFLAGNGMADLHRELRHRTFERYHTLRQQLLPFVASKVVFTTVMLLLCSAVMLGGGGLIFQIAWRQPLALVALTVGYACFAAGLFALLVALVPDERRAGVLNNIAGMLLGLAGGCAFPPDQLPTFMRTHFTPHLPSFWFVNTARNLQAGVAGVAWGPVTLELIGLGAVLTGLAVLLFHRRFKTGLRA
ncbi:MAG: ABC transporter permease [Limisphaerales bacterium]